MLKSIGIYNSSVARFIQGTLFILFIIMYSSLVLSMDTLAESMARSTSLHAIVTHDGNVERIDYYNDAGELTFASDKHYATVIKTRNDSVEIDEYFDEYGRPAQQLQGYYALQREYNNQGQDYKITYLDANKHPMMIRSGCVIIIREFNENNKIIKESYLDLLEKPVKTYALGYARRREYDNKGRNISIQYLDDNDNLMTCGQGYAEVRYIFYETGKSTNKIEYEYYYDEFQKPICLNKGQYGIRFLYDEFGRANTMIYVDQYGKPINTKEGYSTIKRTFYEDDSVKTEYYFDLDGNPIKLTEGQFGILKNGNQTTYLDADGNEIFNLRIILYQNNVLVITMGFIAIALAFVLPKRMNIVLLLIYIGCIIYMTLLFRENVLVNSNFQLFWSYRKFFTNDGTRTDILRNIWLFIPLGAILYKLYPYKRILIVSFLLSIIIEATQYFTGTGLCEMDDVISNSLGGAIGYVAGVLLTPPISNLKVKIFPKAGNYKDHSENRCKNS